MPADAGESVPAGRSITGSRVAFPGPWMRGAGRAADRRLAAAHASAHVSPVASGKSPAGESAMVTAGESAMVTAKTTAVGAATVETTTSPAVEAASTPAAMAAPTMLGPNE